MAKGFRGTTLKSWFTDYRWLGCLVASSLWCWHVGWSLPAAANPVEIARTPNSANIATIERHLLPPEAIRTIDLIRNNGPFPYPRDGIVFGNYERRLPIQPRGYYREYTVPTPGSRNRGARRIVTGGNTIFYYTPNHYNTFQRILNP
jgi:ribonuclease T1